MKLCVYVCVCLSVMPSVRSKPVAMTVWVSTKVTDVKTMDTGESTALLTPLPQPSEFYRPPLIKLVWRLKRTWLIHSSHIIFNSFTSCWNMPEWPQKRRKRQPFLNFCLGLTMHIHIKILFLSDKTHMVTDKWLLVAYTWCNCTHVLGK